MVFGISNSSGDTAYLYGPSTGTNTFLTTPTSDYMEETGYANFANTFPTVIGISASSADTAYLNGASTGTNTFTGTATASSINGSGYSNVAYTFTTVISISTSSTTRPTCMAPRPAPTRSSALRS